jgi:5-methylcytosine-specific restriction endonuclease McrA
MGVAHHDARWRAVRMQAVRRDDFRCTECGARGQLEVHHEIPVRQAPDKAYSLGNCKTLCRSCHLEKTLQERGQLPSSARKEWASLLKEKLNARVCED